MNFFDVFMTLQYNPNAEKPMISICEYLNCKNELETVKSALQKKPNRAQHIGAFPFDEETGRIYDALWKAADAENYTPAEKVGRWFMKMICPPADDEGMAGYHRKARKFPEEEEENTVPITNMKPVTKVNSTIETNLVEPIVENPKNNWDIDEVDNGEVVVVESKVKPNKTDDVHKRITNKKGD